jgi:hypothetical protein
VANKNDFENGNRININVSAAITKKKKKKRLQLIPVDEKKCIVQLVLVMKTKQYFNERRVFKFT